MVRRWLKWVDAPAGSESCEGSSSGSWPRELASALAPSYGSNAGGGHRWKTFSG